MIFLKFPNYYNCSKVYQCRLLWQYWKIEKVKYLGSVCCVVYQCFLSAIDHPDYHASITWIMALKLLIRLAAKGIKEIYIILVGLDNM